MVSHSPPRERRWSRRVRSTLARWLDASDVSASAVMLTTAIVVGVLTGFGAVGFRRLLEFIHRVGYGAWRFDLGRCR